MSENLVLAELTWTEIDEALKERPVALVPVGSVQAQGPHLPVGSDTILASEIARRGALRLKARRIPALILPPIAFTTAEWTAGFAGTLPLSCETLCALLREVCAAAAKQFRAVVLVLPNTEPKLLECIKKAAEELRKSGSAVGFTDFTKKRWAELLGPSFAQGEHAGALKTSLMMAVAPERVRDSVRISLPPIEGSVGGKGAAGLAEAGAEDGYIGDPTAATAEDGETHLDALAEILEVTVAEHLGSKA